jgi:hypothetical protein
MKASKQANIEHIFNYIDSVGNDCFTIPIQLWAEAEKSQEKKKELEKILKNGLKKMLRDKARPHLY